MYDERIHGIAHSNSKECHAATTSYTSCSIALVLLAVLALDPLAMLALDLLYVLALDPLAMLALVKLAFQTLDQLAMLALALLISCSITRSNSYASTSCTSNVVHRTK